ncbi:hypothetical protein FCM35_KLT19033 [Carex littledalei]|uniref:Uncharacterized protein n=1 Tax=Carex littledalei TaxID=544730 RepID=A0A833VEH3_9POAL|nr:hypothetical protein FCM35_KLT19033 [Carex littledalei]
MNLMTMVVHNDMSNTGVDKNLKIAILGGKLILNTTDGAYSGGEVVGFPVQVLRGACRMCTCSRYRCNRRKQELKLECGAHHKEESKRSCRRSQ